MAEIRKLKAVRAIVRPDRRNEYLQAWQGYVEAVGEGDVRAWLFEDQELPGRFLEFTEFEAARGREGELARAVRATGLQRLCVRREGDNLLYREVEM